MKDQSKTKQPLIQKKASLDKASEYAESIINTIREPLIILDQDLRVVTASRSFYEFFKVKPEETEGQLIYNLGNDQWDIPKLRELLETILPEKATFDNYEVEHDFTTIGKRIMLLNARQIKRALGKERIILLAIEDITERKQLESLLIDSEERYRHLFETASDGIVFLEQREGRITHANPASEKMLGYTKKELMGNKLQDIGVLLDMGDFQTTIQNLDKSGIIHYNDVSVRTKSGQQMDTDIYLVDRATLLQCSIRDVTERKRTEEELRKSEEKYRLIFEYSPLGLLSFDEKGVIIACNNNFVKIIGSSREKLSGLNMLKLPNENIVSAVQKALNGNPGLYEGEYSSVTSRKITQVRCLFEPMDVGSGRIPGGVGIIEDITERMREEEALRESENKYRLLADNIHDVIFVLDMNLNYTYVSPSTKILRGYEPEEVMKQLPSKALTPSSWDLVTKTIAEAMELEKEHREINISWTLQLEMMRKDGTTVWTEVKISVIRDENQRPVSILGITRDITERKQAEKRLKETLDRLRKAVETTIQVMVSAVEMRDPYTAGHQSRAANLACAIATEMGLSQDKIDGLRMAGSIHDIGKLSIPAEILSKPTKLTNIEFSLIKEHSRIGYDMLKDVESSWPLAQIVYQHHERMDGSGYPQGLKGDEILMEARIMAVADVMEAMASHRPYRPGLGIDAALTEIEKNKGIFYDNTVADACLRLFREKGYQLT